MNLPRLGVTPGRGALRGDQDLLDRLSRHRIGPEAPTGVPVGQQPVEHRGGVGHGGVGGHHGPRSGSAAGSGRGGGVGGAVIIAAPTAIRSATAASRSDGVIARASWAASAVIANLTTASTRQRSSGAGAGHRSASMRWTRRYEPACRWVATMWASFGSNSVWTRKPA